MSFLLDTNLVSEWTKARPNSGVMAWLDDVDEDRVFLSVISLAELRHGIDRMAQGRRRRLLDEWLRNELPSRFEDRILPITAAVADGWGKLVARNKAVGRPISVMDAFIAATAEVHNLTLVTRNTRDFGASTSSLLNPWTET